MFKWDDVKQTEVSEITARVRDRRPFAFSRWGDGEWRAVLGQRKNGSVNCDGHPYNRELTAELQAVLTGHPPYWLGMQWLSLCKLFPELLPKFMTAHKLNDLDWRQNNVFHLAMMNPEKHSQMTEFFAELRELPCIVIGPSHAKDVTRSMINVIGFINDANVFNGRKQLLEKTEAILSTLREPAFVSISAGMTANLLVDQLWRKFGSQHFIVDVGALWDPYAGVCSRCWMRTARDNGSLVLPR